MVYAKQLTGERFGKLTVLGPAADKGTWNVRCDCGNEKVVKGASLRSGNTKSCGCLMKKNPGRPRRPETQAVISLVEFIDAVYPNIAPMREFLKTRGVLVRGDGTYYVNGVKFGPYPNAIAALCNAILHTVAGMK